VAVFGSYGYDLLNEESWPQRKADADWQAWVIRSLREKGADPSFVEALKADVGALRFKPDEVVASSILTDWPIGFADARTTADAIVKQLVAARGAAAIGSSTGN
jgi:hypothetical protein